MIEISGLTATAGASGALISSMLAVGLSDHPGLLETIAAGGLGASLSILLVKWMLSQYNRTAQRLAKLEDERALLIRETVSAMTVMTKDVRDLVNASQSRGVEVRELVAELKNRPCLVKGEE